MYIDATTYMYFYVHNIIILKAVYLCTSKHKTTTTVCHVSSYAYMYYTVTDELKAVSDELNQRENEYVGKDILLYMLQINLQPSACFKLTGLF